MPRIRTIKPEFPQSESIGAVSRDARLLFVQLWTICDDYGRCRANARLLAGQLYPYDADAVSLLPAWLDELQAGGLVAVYQVEGSTYLEVLGWSKHQRVDNAGKSSIPPRPEGAPLHVSDVRRDSPRVSASLGDSRLDLGPRTKDLGPRKGTEDLGPGIAPTASASPQPSALPTTSPQKARRGHRPKGEPAPTSETWAAYAAAFGERYGVEPVRNATVNGQLAQFVTRVPAADAPHVARFYVEQTRGLYVSARHTVALLLRDAEGLHADWRRGQSITDHEARSLDRTQANADAFAPLLRAAREREALPETAADAIPLLPTG